MALPVLVWIASGHASLCLAGEGEEWLRLDRELERLELAAAEDAAAGPAFSGVLRTAYYGSADIHPGGAGNLGGFILDLARLQVDGQVHDWRYSLEYEAASGVPTLLQAYVSRQVNEHVNATVGQFRLPFLWSSVNDIDRLLFLPRTTPGALTNPVDVGDQGIMADGALDRFHWYLGVSNSVDGPGTDVAVTARVDFNALGEGGRMTEGAWGAPEDTYLTIGVGAQLVEESDTDGDAFGADVLFVMDRFSAHAEFAHNRDTPQIPVVGDRADSDNLGVTLSYLFHPQWEAAIRYEALGDRDVAAPPVPPSGDDIDTRTVYIGLNHYLQGHDAKFQINFADGQADPPGSDTQIFSIGFTVGF